MISIQNLSMSFPVPRRYYEYLLFRPGRYHQALQNINILVNKGDRVAFLGLNGAGKTTLMKLIGGLLYPGTGSIEVNGYDTVSHNTKARRSVGFVLNEERSFYWRLTAVQNLEFFGALDNLHGQELQSKICELLELVGLEAARDKLVATFSSGMKQRLALARGMLRNPEILILDEPTRTLDPQAVKDVKHLIKQRIHENEQRTLLIATHRFDEAEELCNKICIMKEGRLLAYLGMAEILSAHRTIEEFYETVMQMQTSQ
jgi:ABC-2 type transport system ATP-binding protein